MDGIRNNQGLDLWELDVFKGLPEPVFEVITRPCDL